ncbi:MAG: bifunctional diaminohydroxyphosphoribosylaminopyrimidine deaminase/5-amino-6-(5-phosphoribosylamino)uracil reductase RibD [Dehalococcoidia bacterium]
MAISRFMQEALDAARLVRGTTSPNPWVGAVIVRDGRPVVVGATSPPPGPHAEADAIRAAGAAAEGATMYVTLEPCVPFEGKRTQACAEAIIEAGIAHVVIALEDHDPRVHGAGIAMLREAGVQVEVGDGRDEALALLRPYLKHRETGLPYVIAKFAASLDGQVAARTGDSKWITGEAARDMAHRQRAWVDAVVVGSGTVLADDPELTARPGGVANSRQPLRVVVDARGRVPAGARLFAAAGPVMVATTAASPVGWRRAVATKGAELLQCEPAASGGVDLAQLLRVLGDRGVLAAWVEGGPTLLGSLFDSGLVDEVWAFLAPKVVGGGGFPAVRGRGVERVADAWVLREAAIEPLPGGDVLVRGYVGPWEPDDGGT